MLAVSEDQLCASTGAKVERLQHSCKVVLLSLPDHLLTAIFKQLDGCDLASLRLSAHALVAPASSAVQRLKPCIMRSDTSLFSHLLKLDLTGVLAEDWHEELLATLLKGGITSLSIGKVNHLSLAGTEVIGDLAQLKSLEVVEAPLLDTTLQPFSRLTALQHLSLRDCCKLTDSGLQVLSKLKRLESLDLSMCWQLTDNTLGMIADSLQQLSRLDLAGCEHFGAEGLRQLCRLSKLQTLLMPACWQLTDECLEVVAKGMPQLRCLGLFEAGENVTDQGLLQLASLTNLVALDLGYSCWMHTSAGLRHLLGQLKGLQMLNIGGCEGSSNEVMDTVAGLTRLTQLDASECQRMTPRGVQQLARLPRLLELNLGWNLKLPGAALEHLASAGSPLTKLDLSFCGEMDDKGLEGLRGLPHIKSLCLRKCTRVGDQGLSHLASCSSLETLDLSYCPLLTSSGLEHLAALPRLALLRLVDCPRATTVLGMRAVGYVKSLRTVDASDNKRLDDGCMQALSFMSQLTALSIRACPKVTDHGLLALTRITHLRELDIDMCVAVSPAAVSKLQHRLVRLKRVRPHLVNAASRVQTMGGAQLL